MVPQKLREIQQIASTGAPQPRDHHESVKNPTQESWCDVDRDPGEPAVRAQDTSKVSVLHESGKHFTRNAKMEPMVAPSDFGNVAPELEAAIRKVAFCGDETDIFEGKEFLRRFQILQPRAASTGAF